MSLIVRRALLESYLPLLQAKRLRSKINIQKPQQPHHEKLKFLQLAQPYFIKPNKDKKPFELCQKDVQLYKKDEENSFQAIIARELLSWFHKSRLVVFYHMNPISKDKEFEAFVMFKKQNMHFKNYGKRTLELAVKGTPYEAVLPFYQSKNMTVFSPEPEIKKLLKINKKFPQLILLAAIFEGKFISKDELLAYSLIPDLKTAQSGLVQTLNAIGGQVVGHLSAHQSVLVSQLQERIKQLEEK